MKYKVVFLPVVSVGVAFIAFVVEGDVAEGRREGSRGGGGGGGVAVRERYLGPEK